MSPVFSKKTDTKLIVLSILLTAIGGGIYGGTLLPGQIYAMSGLNLTVLPVDRILGAFYGTVMAPVMLVIIVVFICVIEFLFS